MTIKQVSQIWWYFKVPLEFLEQQQQTESRMACETVNVIERKYDVNVIDSVSITL